MKFLLPKIFPVPVSDPRHEKIFVPVFPQISTVPTEIYGYRILKKLISFCQNYESGMALFIPFTLKKKFMFFFEK
jgi:hypothetical protein